MKNVNWSKGFIGMHCFLNRIFLRSLISLTLVLFNLKKRLDYLEDLRNISNTSVLTKKTDPRMASWEGMSCGTSSRRSLCAGSRHPLTPHIPGWPDR